MKIIWFKYKFYTKWQKDLQATEVIINYNEIVEGADLAEHLSC